MNALRQLVAVIALNFGGLKDRLWTSLVAVVGIACVVGVLLSMLSLSVGLSRTVQAAANPIRAIVVAKGNNNELGANISREAATQIMTAPGVQKDVDGKPIASANISPIFRRSGRATTCRCQSCCAGSAKRALS